MVKKLNAHVVIFSVAAVLALATASECHSITHLPSLLYGALLWGWWALIASLLWRLDRKYICVPSLSQLGSISIHLLAGTALGIVHLLLIGKPGVQPMQDGAAREPALSVWTSLLNINRLGMELLLYGFLLGLRE